MFCDIFSIQNLRQIERKAQQNNVSLMKRAANELYEWITERYPSTSSILIAVGQGNNGGDALYCGLLLHKNNYKVSFWLPEEPKSKEALAALSECLRLELNFITDSMLPSKMEPDLIVDGFFGIGLNRKLDAKWQNRIKQLNELAKPILAIDTPSGLDPYRGSIYGESIRANTTLTFLCAKSGLHTNEGIEFSGKVIVSTLGLEKEYFPSAKGTIAPIEHFQLNRPKNSHKGTFGTVGIIGGAESMLGAALLCSRAALQFGAGKIHVGTLSPYPVDPITPELMFSDISHVLTQSINVFAIGPGLSSSRDAKTFLEETLNLSQLNNIPIVIDADALNLIAQNDHLSEIIESAKNEKIMTPHPAEAARLLKTNTALIQANRVKAAQQIATKFNAVTILKGAGSIIARPDGYYRLNTSGSATLASGGQGDVLTGMCAALLAQKLDAFDAASVATYVHGLAGEEYEQKSGEVGLTASLTINIAKNILNRLIKKN